MVTMYLVPLLRYSALIMAWPWDLGYRSLLLRLLEMALFGRSHTSSNWRSRPNYGLSCIIFEIKRDSLLVEGRDFSHPCIRRPHKVGLCWNITIWFCMEKLKWCGYPTVKKSLKIWYYDYSFWYNTGTWQTAWRTDGRPSGQTDRYCTNA